MHSSDRIQVSSIAQAGVSMILALDAANVLSLNRCVRRSGEAGGGRERVMQDVLDEEVRNDILRGCMRETRNDGASPC